MSVKFKILPNEDREEPYYELRIHYQLGDSGDNTVETSTYCESEEDDDK